MNFLFTLFLVLLLIKNGYSQVLKVDTKIRENGKAHHTSEFDLVERLESPVLRRGFTFVIEIFHNGGINPMDMRLIFEYGTYASEHAGTKKVIDIRQRYSSRRGDWSAAVVRSDTHSLMLQILTSAESIIGKWEMKVLANKNRNENYAYRYPKFIYLLFNPWASKDAVYLADDIWRKEGVLNDVGKMWMGIPEKNVFSHAFKVRAWHYGQFERDVLDAALLAIARTGIGLQQISDPIHISRAIAAAANSQDDYGVVYGKWKGGYEGGVAPTVWQGSTLIMQRYFRERKPIKYGQCWVFAGVASTMLRAVGIPTRTITTYYSAHDTDKSLTIDYYHNRHNQMDETLTKDSIWNFHVWNEAWMRRNDLSSSYSGWQVIDATPQERSGRIYRVGPTPIPAIKRADIKTPYDVPFVFSEVNSDVIYWQKKVIGSQRLCSASTKLLGKFISVKKPGKFLSYGDSDRMDITHTYKHQEGSSLSLNTVSKALSMNPHNRYKRDISNFEISILPVQNKEIGTDFKFGVLLENNNAENRSVEMQMTLYTSYYTGKIKKMLKTYNKRLSLPPLSNLKIYKECRKEDYINHLDTDYSFIFEAFIKCPATNQFFVDVYPFDMHSPKLSIKKHGEFRMNEPTMVHAMFRNPLKKELTDPKWIIEGLGDPIIVNSSTNVGDVYYLKKNLIPKKSGSKTLLISFDSKELNDIEGFLNVRVKKRRGEEEAAEKALEFEDTYGFVDENT